MKKLLIAILALICQMPAWAQVEANMPTIIAFPSRLYMNKNKFGQEVQTNGRTRFMPDYDKAFLNDANLKTALSGISNALREHGYDNVMMLESALNDIDDQASMNVATDAETSIEDKILESVRPDIRIEVEFYPSGSTLGPRKGWVIKVEAIDAYTNEPVAHFNDVVDPTSDVPDLVLKKVVAGQIENFSGQMLTYYKDLRDRGRKVNILFHTTSNGGINLEEDEINGDPIQDYLEDWIRDRALNNNSSLRRGTEHMMDFVIRIPFFGEDGKPIDTKRWSRSLRNDLKTLGIKATLKLRGLGRVDIMLGEK